MTDVIKDEAREPALKDFADDIRAALPSYANVAKKGKRRKDFPYILYVHTGEEERRTMSTKTWTCFFEKMQVVCLNLTLKGEVVPKIEWSGFAKGVGLIAPANKASRTLVKKLASQVKVTEFTFKAWARGEKGKYIPLSIRLSATMPSTDFSSGKFMQAVIIANKLPDKYVIRGVQAGRWRREGTPSPHWSQTGARRHPQEARRSNVCGNVQAGGLLPGDVPHH